MSYNVAFVGTKQAGVYQGVVTWTSYLSKQAFEAQCVQMSADERAKRAVIEEDISEERCIELVKSTPLGMYARVAAEEATLPDGSIDLAQLSRGMRDVLIVQGLFRVS